MRCIPWVARGREGQGEIGAADRELVGFVLAEQDGTRVAQASAW